MTGPTRFDVGSLPFGSLFAVLVRLVFPLAFCCSVSELWAWNESLERICKRYAIVASDLKKRLLGP